MIEILKQALEALEECRRDPRLKYEHPTLDKAITSLRQAIAELESQEPDAWRYALDASIEGPRWIYIDKDPHQWLLGPAMTMAVIEKLYAHPPQRTEPVGVMVSMDVSKGDEPEYRIFGRIYEVMKDGEGKDEVTYLAIEDSRNFDTPPQRTWVGLTDEEVNTLWGEWKDAVCLDHKTWAQAIEAQLRWKNT
jgi:hypothetical protein